MNGIGWQIVGGVETEYTLNGTNIISETISTGERLYYFYDEKGTPIAFNYYAAGSDTRETYYYVKNIFGDVISLVNSYKQTVVTYSYDTWGNITSITGTLAATIGTLNPYRYRGYLYDSETGFYYLNSRYYDPLTGRFINADSLLNQKSVLGNNMFTYCLNNPVNMGDSTGKLPFFLVTAAIGAVAGAIIGGVVAAKSGGNVWAGIGIGAAAGGLTGAGLGAAAGLMLAGSATACTAAVTSGAGMLATAVSTGGTGAGMALIADNILRAANGNEKQVVSNTTEICNNVYYHVTSFQAAKSIIDSNKLIPSSIEKSVCVLNFQPTIEQAKQLGAFAYETVIKFSTNCTTFVADNTVPFKGAFRNIIDGTVKVIDVFEVGFK